MKKYVFVIMILSLVSLHVGCRAKLDTSSSMKRQQSDVIGLELRRLDSLWGSMSERLTYKVEFYAPWEIAGDARNDDQGEKYTKARQNPATPKVLGDQAAHTMAMPADGLTLESGVGGMGAVKSIEITTEKTGEVSSISGTDSTYYTMTTSDEAQQKETATEARQDNGTVTIVFVVFAVAALIYSVIKSMKK